MHLYFSHGYSHISECNDLTLPLLNTDYSRLLKIILQCFHRPNVQTSKLFFEPLLGQAENFPASFNLRNLSSMSVVTLKIFYSLFLSPCFSSHFPILFLLLFPVSLSLFLSSYFQASFCLSTFSHHLVLISSFYFNSLPFPQSHLFCSPPMNPACHVSYMYINFPCQIIWFFL